MKLQIGDRVNTYSGSVATVLAINGDKAQIEILSLPKMSIAKGHACFDVHVNDRVFSGVPLQTLTKIAFPCHVCKKDIGWDAPSGCCSTECVKIGQESY